MKKVELIREIFDILMSEGYYDNKQDAISEYTRDKFENPVYVKKLDIKNGDKIDSISVVSLDYTFDSVVDCDVRVAINDYNIGKRVIAYINELDYEDIQKIHDWLVVTYSKSFEEKCYNTLMRDFNDQPMSGPTISVNRSSLQYVLALFKKAYLDKN